MDFRFLLFILYGRGWFILGDREVECGFIGIDLLFYVSKYFDVYVV